MIRKTRSARRRGAAAVEFAVCLPLILLILAGLWEVGRIAEVQNVMWNCAREGARDASTAQVSLNTVAANLVTYLQSAEPSAFASGHSTSLISPVITLPPNSTGYTCWDNTANQELFTMWFTDLTTTNVTDPMNANQLDIIQIGVSAPYKSIRVSPMAQITGLTRLNTLVTWVSMRDQPFQLPASLPAQ